MGGRQCALPELGLHDGQVALHVGGQTLVPVGGVAGLERAGEFFPLRGDDDLRERGGRHVVHQLGEERARRGGEVVEIAGLRGEGEAETASVGMLEV